MDTNGIPEEHVTALQAIVNVVYMRLSEKQDIGEAIERAYRLGKSQGRIEGHDMASETVRRSNEEFKRRMET